MAWRRRRSGSPTKPVSGSRKKRFANRDDVFVRAVLELESWDCGMPGPLINIELQAAAAARVEHDLDHES